LGFQRYMKMMDLQALLPPIFQDMVHPLSFLLL
jgi:hypothetical protein